MESMSVRFCLSADHGHAVCSSRTRLGSASNPQKTQLATQPGPLTDLQSAPSPPSPPHHAGFQDPTQGTEIADQGSECAPREVGVQTSAQGSFPAGGGTAPDKQLGRLIARAEELRQEMDAALQQHGQRVPEPVLMGVGKAGGADAAGPWSGEPLSKSDQDVSKVKTNG